MSHYTEEEWAATEARALDWEREFPDSHAPLAESEIDALAEQCARAALSWMEERLAGRKAS